MHSFANGIKWVAVERFSNQLIQFVVSIIIARIVSPQEFGVLGIIMVFINVSQVFIDSGFGTSLVYFNKLDTNSLNTTFVFNFCVSSFLCLLICIAAPYLQSFYDISNFANYLRVASLVLLSNSLIVVPTSILKIKLDFKSISISGFASNFISAVIALIVVFSGYGIWALICQIVSKSVLQSVFLFYQTNWRPKISFHYSSFKVLYNYGIKIFGTSAITKFTDEGIASVIGKLLTPYNLGLYTRAGQFATFPTSCVGSIISTVLFPTLSSLKNNNDRYNGLYVKSIKAQAMFAIPLFLWIALLAKPIVLILLTEKWIHLVPVLQILCVGRILALPAITTEQCLISKGRSDLYLYQQICKLILKIVLVAVTLPFGIVAVAFADAFQTLAQFFITNFMAKSVTLYRLKDQVGFIFPYFVSALLSLLPGMFIMNYIENLYINATLTIVVCFCIYVLALSTMFKNSCDFISYSKKL